jgi:hypothetical protein
VQGGGERLRREGKGHLRMGSVRKDKVVWVKR